MIGPLITFCIHLIFWLEEVDLDIFSTTYGGANEYKSIYNTHNKSRIVFFVLKKRKPQFGFSYSKNIANFEASFFVGTKILKL